MNYLIDAVLMSIRMAFFMFWDTLWPLVLGFTLSGVVQAFVSRDEMRRLMGDHRPKTVARASLFGAVSSSCSYAASAMAKSLFQKGADFTTAMIFMIASTNLVLELGLVLWILLGWQFALSEYVGGAIMIALMALLSQYFLTPKLIEKARERLARGEGGMSGHEAHAAMGEERQSLPWSQRIRSRAGWADAASYTMADLIMLRRELVIGYVVAGFLAVLIPNSAWNVIFFHGHGFWTSLENVIVGPFIALISFVCSIGNVPLAAALWKGGISFGGVVSFIFADLISLPLILIYRKFYGRALTLRLVALMWLVMSVAGLVTEYLFMGLRLVPESRPFQVVEPTFQWNYTTFLNLLFLVVAAGVFYLYKNRERLGGGQGYALDPICGMQVETANAPARAEHNGQTFYFCSDRCRERFVSNPDRYAKPGAAPEGPEMPAMGQNLKVDGMQMLPLAMVATEVDPVCGMSADPATAPSHIHEGHTYYFCCDGCRDSFAAEPERYLASTGQPH
jgi:YHS domain-containing protein/uncharacterized membrane protein YraQ (UPF0718 family)